MDPEWMARDFVLYHAWKLVAVFRQHVARRPRSRGYLAWFYGRLLRQFITATGRLREGAAEAPGAVSPATGSSVVGSGHSGGPRRE